MREILKNALVITLVTGLCLSFVGITAAEEPIFDYIVVSPEEPTRESEVSFSVDVTGDYIEEVYIKVQECVDPGTPDYFCHQGLLNVSLSNVSGNWEGTGTLQYDDSDEGHCWLVIKSDGTWYDYKNDNSTWTDFIIAEGDDGSDGADGGDSTDDTGGTPGFELILVLISIVVALSIYKRKR